VGYYGRDRAGAKRKVVEAAAIEAAATAEKAVSTQDVHFPQNPAPPKLRERAAAVVQVGPV
jgi:hypothetical protein